MSHVAIRCIAAQLAGMLHTQFLSVPVSLLGWDWAHYARLHPRAGKTEQGATTSSLGPKLPSVVLS